MDEGGMTEQPAIGGALSTPEKHIQPRYM